MLYEIRLYAIARGRLADIRRRMLCDVPPLFAEHGMRTVGHWTVVAGRDLPAFLYVLEWTDAAERDACWQSFYGDRRWWEVRARSNAGSELVERYGLWLMRPNAALPLPFRPVQPTGGEGVHEMLLQFVAIGARAAVDAHLASAVLPAIEQAGGSVLAVLDMVAGPSVPSVAIFVAWPDSRARSAGRRRLEQTASPMLGRGDVYLLQPVHETDFHAGEFEP